MDRPTAPPRPLRNAADHETAARLLLAVKAGADIRNRKIRRLRAAIKVNAYENDLKLIVAIERLMRQE